jgi:hypothetical protein
MRELVRGGIKWCVYFLQSSELKSYFECRTLKMESIELSEY